MQGWEFGSFLHTQSYTKSIERDEMDVYKSVLAAYVCVYRRMVTYADTAVCEPAGERGDECLQVRAH